MNLIIRYIKNIITKSSTMDIKTLLIINLVIFSPKKLGPYTKFSPSPPVLGAGKARIMIVLLLFD